MLPALIPVDQVHGHDHISWDLCKETVNTFNFAKWLDVSGNRVEYDFDAST